MATSSKISLYLVINDTTPIQKYLITYLIDFHESLIYVRLYVSKSKIYYLNYFFQIIFGFPLFLK